MLQAQQRQVVQTANINLISLRQAEVDYFASFFNSFGTQTAILAAMSINTATNIFGLNADCNIFFVYMCWIGTTLACIACLRLLLGVTFISIYAQGLALRGPLGSMAVAVEGMIDEQEGVVHAFTHAVFWSAISVVGVLWLGMPSKHTPAPVIASVIIIAGVYYWYIVVKRIYHRFDFSSDKKMTFRENDSVLEYQLKPSVIATTMNPMKPISSKDNDSTNEISKKDYKYISTDETSSVAGSIKSRGTIKTKRTTGNRDGLQEPLIEDTAKSSPKSLKWSFPVAKAIGRALTKDNVNSIETKSIYNSSGAPSESGKSIAMRSNSGKSVARSDARWNTYVSPTLAEPISESLEYAAYISIKSGKGSLFNDPWKRRYMVILNSDLFLYESKAAFDNNPSESMNRRPISLQGMSVHVTTSEPPFEIVVTPIEEEDERKSHEFRCETLHEANAWIEILKRATEISES